MTKEIQVIVGGIAPNIIHESLQNELGKQARCKAGDKAVPCIGDSNRSCDS